MEPEDQERGYDEIKRCLAEADRAFARAGDVDDDQERLRLIEEAESWLMRAERRLAGITGREPPSAPTAIAAERRSFSAEREPGVGLIWPRTPRI